MEDEVVPVAEGSPESFGWMRRPEHDSETGVCWELPSGKLLMYPRGKPLRLQRYQMPTLSEIGRR